MREPAIECEGLRRVYGTRRVLGRGGETTALDGLDLTIPQGVVFGILGPNGAGKTTLVRILSTLLTPTAGAARVMGFDVARDPREVRRQVGLVLGGDRGLYWRLTGQENLQYFGVLQGLTPRQASAQAADLLELVGLGGRGSTVVEQYSRGMRQRLHIARGLLADPPVILMDEPTIGLDPLAARELRDMVPRLARQGKTIVLTTHYMSEADLLCNSIALVNHGRAVAVGTPADFKRRFGGVKVIDLTLRDARPQLHDELLTVEGVLGVDEAWDGVTEKLTVHVALDAQISDALVEIVGQANVLGLIEREANLEEAYLNMLR